MLLITGCIPLNGCGKFNVFPFILSFVFIVGFVAVNLFVSMVLEGVVTVHYDFESKCVLNINSVQFIYDDANK